MAIGRPLKIKTPDEMWNLWEEFREYCDKGYVDHVASAGKVLQIPRRIIYTLEKFQVKCNISRETWQHYKKRRAFVDTIKRIEEEVFARKKEAMINLEGSTTGLIFDMKANYGINDKLVIDASIDGTYHVTMDLGGPKDDSEGNEDNSL